MQGLSVHASWTYMCPPLCTIFSPLYHGFRIWADSGSEQWSDAAQNLSLPLVFKNSNYQYFLVFSAVFDVRWTTVNSRSSKLRLSERQK